MRRVSETFLYFVVLVSYSMFIIAYRKVADQSGWRPRLYPRSQDPVLWPVSSILLFPSSCCGQASDAVLSRVCKESKLSSIKEEFLVLLCRLRGDRF